LRAYTSLRNSPFGKEGHVSIIAPAMLSIFPQSVDRCGRYQTLSTARYICIVVSNL
jgi:hypothetical protein